MRNNYRTIIHCTLLSLLAMSAASCGLLDYDLDENPDEVAVTMQLERDTLYVMTGDHFTLTPLFDPETVNISDLFFYTDKPDLLEFNAEGFEALEAGWAMVYAESVSSRIKDSCAVCIMEPWEYVFENYPHETVIYAEITIDGVAPDENAEIAAFVGSELRAWGDYNMAYHQEFFIFRVGHPLPDPALPPERINILYYDAKGLKLYSSSQWLETDGESHGTPSHPLKIDLK